MSVFWVGMRTQLVFVGPQFPRRISLNFSTSTTQPSSSPTLKQRHRLDEEGRPMLQQGSTDEECCEPMSCAMAHVFGTSFERVLGGKWRAIVTIVQRLRDHQGLGDFETFYVQIWVCGWFLYVSINLQASPTSHFLLHLQHLPTTSALP